MKIPAHICPDLPGGKCLMCRALPLIDKIRRNEIKSNPQYMKMSRAQKIKHLAAKITK